MRVFVLLLIAWTATAHSSNIANEIREMIVNDLSEEEVHEQRLKWMAERRRVSEDRCSISITGVSCLGLYLRLIFYLAARNAYAAKNPLIKYSVECGREVVKKGEKRLSWLKPIHLKQAR